MASRRFQKTKEDFICKKCGFFVQGDGYTNHCPKCLWSRHLDINPGDRQATCQGLMEPIGIKIRSGKHTILHRCVLCGFERWNRVARGDNFNVILQLSNRSVKL